MFRSLPKLAACRCATGWPAARRAVLPAAALAAALAAMSLPAQAGPSFPPRKPGLWEIRMGQVEGSTESLVVTQCVDAATDKLLQDFGSQQPQMNRKFCQEETRNEAGKMIVHRETCQEGSAKVSTHMVIGGDFNSHYSVQSTTRHDPPRPGAAAPDLRMEATWKGPCAAGQKPGDMLMPGGMRMNVLDVMKMMPGGAGRGATR